MFFKFTYIFTVIVLILFVYAKLYYSDFEAAARLLYKIKKETLDAETAFVIILEILIAIDAILIATSIFFFIFR